MIKNQLTALLSVVALFMLPGCGGDTNNEPDTGRVADGTEVEAGSAEDSEPVSPPYVKPDKPEWDYTDWGWLSYDDGLFTIAVPPGAAYDFALDAEPIVNPKDDPKPGSTIKKIKCPNGMFAMFQIQSNPEDPSDEDAMKRFMSQAAIGLQVQMQIRDTHSRKRIDYVGDYAEQFVFHTNIDFLNYGRNQEYINTVRFVATKENIFPLIVQSRKVDYDEKLIDQWLDSFELEKR